MIRYFKASDGNVTVFRQSGSRLYRSALIRWHSGKQQCNAISFSAALADPQCGRVAAAEIDKAEFDRLRAIKAARLASRGQQFSSPQDSWVLNSEIG